MDAIAIERGPRAELGDPRARSWMDRKDHRQAPGNLCDRIEDAAERFSMIDIRRAMQRQHRISLCVDLHTVADSIESRGIAEPEQCIDHHIADAVDPLRCNAL